jgi:L-threonylcarbamoyladenylate synthase
LLILDGGPCEVGIESTIVDCTRGVPVLLRPGSISTEALAHVCGQPVRSASDFVSAAMRAAADGAGRDASLAAANTALSAAPRASGTLESHYAPRASLRIVSLAAPELAGLTHVALLAPDAETLADLRTAAAGLQIVAEAALSESLDPVAAAAKLFDALHKLDAALRDVAPGKAAILTTPYPEPGLGLAIADRLRRAAAAN